MFRSGALPLAIETGRYSRQPIPVNERTCKLCSTGDIENEFHFLMLCPLYCDLRYDLFAVVSTKINYFKTTDIMSNFLSIMNCPSIQPILCIYSTREENVFYNNSINFPFSNIYILERYPLFIYAKCTQ